MKNKKRITIGVVVVLLALAAILAVIMLKKFAPNKTHMSLTKYFQVTDQGMMPVVLEDDICGLKAIEKDGHIYVDREFVTEKLNHRFYWDANENMLLYTTSTKLISAALNSKDCYINNKSRDSKDYTIAVAQDNVVYVALDYVQQYTAMDYKQYKKPNRIVIHTVYNKDISYADAKDDVQIRNKQSIKSPILQDVKSGQKLRVLAGENKDTGFMKVMSESGVIGYVQSKKMKETYKKQSETTFREESYSHILMDKQVNLVWHQVTNQSANGRLSGLLSATKGVNVVAPTWFETSDNDGNVTSLASDSYVQTAHQAGVQVWALCSDFGPKMKIGKVLGTTSKRQKLVKNLIAEAIRYDLDGINIDFENVKKDSGEDFIQFVRELGIMCRNNGVVLSIDNYPPAGGISAYYNRKEQAEVADYVITMSYDEHYAGSKEAGPVSSISYVTNSIQEVGEEVPAEQMVIALPFYSRHWKEKTKGGKAKLSSEACSMKGAQTVLKDSGKKATWDDATGMNYVEYTESGTVHKIWIEDAKSLELKMKAVSDANLGGVAFWKLGLEDASVWNMIEKYVKH